MSLKIQKYIETSLEKNQNLFNAEVINFPNEKKFNGSKDSKINNLNHWSISDKSSDDQFRAILGICFMIGALTLIGLYSNLI
tara:strand:+ start:473 stop:718 length:246 start_codon:yes stop_codon:yes gene_type:complete